VSAGHGHGHGGDIDTAPLSSQAMDRVMANPEIRARLYGHMLNYDYDLPYLAGYSQDGQTIYIDRHLPKVLTCDEDGRKTPFAPARFVMLHEIMEKACIDVLHWPYHHAHGAANGYERRGVLAAGMFWDPYNKVLYPYIKSDEREKLVKIPPDLDMTPYYAKPVNQSLVDHILQAQGKGGGKHNKKEVEYSKGHAVSHCGPTANWPRGSCIHFEEPSGCELVRGYIDRTYWCRLFRKQA
jgi:hypothetical protein